MAASSSWGMTPQHSIEAACRRWGRAAVIAGCIDLLRGSDVDPALIYALGGPPARWAIDGAAPGPDYWLRVWALRGLLWTWDDSALPVIKNALSDPAWRVREMAAKVAGRHMLGDLLSILEGLRDDSVPRVRAAAERAVHRIIAARA